MIGSRQMERVLSAAGAAGAKVVLVGDAEHLQAIEASAAFRALTERHGAAEITGIRRQRELAHTRADVAELNQLARERMRDAGALGADQVVQTERGERAFAPGDRVMFLRNERSMPTSPGFARPAKGWGADAA